jgi:hypothetical protein
MNIQCFPVARPVNSAPIAECARGPSGESTVAMLW